MAFRFIVDCSGEDHELMYDRGRLHVDPAHHDEDLERSLAEMGAELPYCLRFADAADTKTDISTTEFSTHLGWLLWELLSGGMLADYEFNRVTVDYVRPVLPFLAPYHVTFDGVPSADLAEFFMETQRSNEASRRLQGVMNALNGWADKEEYRVRKMIGDASEAEHRGQSTKADKLVQRSNSLQSAVWAARAAHAASYVLYRSSGSSPDVSYIEDAARFCRLAKSSSVSAENWNLAMEAEERWQIQHVLKAVASIQEGKPWPSV